MRLDPEAKCILHVYGNGTRLTHVVFSPYGDRLAALRLPELTPHQAACLQVTRLLVTKFAGEYEKEDDDEPRPGVAEALDEQHRSGKGIPDFMPAP